MFSRFGHKTQKFALCATALFLGLAPLAASTILTSSNAEVTTVADTVVYPKGIEASRTVTGRVYYGVYNQIMRHEAGVEAVVAGGVSTGSGDGPALTARFNNIENMKLLAPNKMYIVDRNNQAIRLFDMGTGVVTTVAGRSGWYGSVIDGVGTGARLYYPYDIAGVYQSGVAYISTNYKIRKLDLSTNQVTWVAGNLTWPYNKGGCVDGHASRAILNNPRGLDILPSTNSLYLSDYSCHRIRQVNLGTGQVTTLSGILSYGSTNGPLTSARWYYPLTMAAIDANGQQGAYLYSCTMQHNRCRLIDLATGVVSTAIGGSRGCRDGIGGGARFDHPNGMALDYAATGTAAYILDLYNFRVRYVKVSSAPGPTSQPVAPPPTVSSTYMSESYTSVTTVTRGISRPYDVEVEPPSRGSDTYVASSSSRFLRRYVGGFGVPFKWELSPGNVDPLDPSTVVLDPTFRPNFKECQSACEGKTKCIAVHYCGRSAGADYGKCYTARAFLASSIASPRCAGASNGKITQGFKEQAGSFVYSNRDGPLTVAYFRGVSSVAASGVRGVVYVTDYGNHRIKKVDFAADQVVSVSFSSGFTDGPISIARFYYPRSIERHPNSQIYYIGDHQSLRKYDATLGQVTTLAADTSPGLHLHQRHGHRDGPGTIAAVCYVYAITVDDVSNALYFTVRSNSIRKIDLATNEVTSFVGRIEGGNADGSLATGARIYHPFGVAFDSQRNLLYAISPDTQMQTIRVIDLAAQTMRPAAGRYSSTLRDGLGTQALFYYPYGITVDNSFAGHSRIYVTDSYNNAVRLVQETITQAPTHTLTPTACPSDTRNPTSTVSPTQSPRVPMMESDFAMVDTERVLDHRVSFVAVSSKGGQSTYYLARCLGSDHKICSLEAGNSAASVQLVAGQSSYGHRDGIQSVAMFYGVWGIALDERPTNPILYISDLSAQLVRRVDTANNEVTTVAGGYLSYSLRNGVASYARFYNPRGIAFDATRDKVYVGCYRRIAAIDVTNANYVTTLAGSGIDGVIDGPASVAQFRNVYGLALHNTANELYIADYSNFNVRVYDFSTRQVYLVAGTGISALVDGPLASASFGHPTSIAIDFNAPRTDTSMRCKKRNNVGAMSQAWDMCGQKAAVTGYSGECASKCFEHTGFSCQGYGFQSPSTCHLYANAESCGNETSIDWYTCWDTSKTFLYVTSVHDRVRTIDLGARQTGHVAGWSHGFRDGIGSIVLFRDPYGIAIDPNAGTKTFVIADYGNNRIRRLFNAPTKNPTTFSPTRTPTTSTPSRAPTTGGPTTSSPSRCPTTQNPTSRGPTTQGPTTRNPTTGGPTTGGPTTRNPTTKGPTTSSPTSRGPTTRGPTTRNPTTGGPTTGGPTTQGPTTRNPTTGGPTTGGPTTQGPTTRNPTTGGPTTGGPTTQGPTTRNPTTRGPTTSHPGTSIPTTTPTTGGPTTTGPTTQGPTTRGPVTAHPSTVIPTLCPTSRSPVTLTPSNNPTTSSPTACPTTALPTTTPTTCGPTTCGPTTCAPTTCGPTTLAPTENPTTASPTGAPSYTPCTTPPDSILANVAPGSCSPVPHDTNCDYACRPGLHPDCRHPSIRCVRTSWIVGEARCIPEATVVIETEYPKLKGGYSARYWVEVRAGGGGSILNLCNLSVTMSSNNTWLSFSPKTLYFAPGAPLRRAFVATADIMTLENTTATVEYRAGEVSEGIVGWSDPPLAQRMELEIGAGAYIPSIVSVRIGNDYSSLEFLFRHTTDMAGMVPDSPCSDILDEPTLALLGIRPSCLWQAAAGSGSRLLIARLGFQATFAVGSRVNIRPFVIRSADGKSPYANTTAEVYLIERPALLPAIAASIAGPQAVSNCSSLALHGGSSVGGAGKNLEFRWSVVPAGGAYPSEVPNMNGTGAVYRIAGGTLLPGKYEVRLVVYNYLGQNASTSSPLVVFPGRIPIIRPHLANPASLYWARDFYLQANLDPGSCDARFLTSAPGSESTVATGNATLRLEWRQLAPNETTEFNVTSHMLPGLTLDKYYVFLPAGSLASGDVYGFTADAFLDTGSARLKTSTARIFLRAGRQPVVACLDGGAGGSKAHFLNDDLVADASCSQDPDNLVASNVNAAIPLQFSWTCALNTTKECYVASDRLAPRTDQETFRIPHSLLLEGQYSLTVVVIGQGGRIARASTRFDVSASDAPRVTIAHQNYKPRYNRERVVLTSGVVVGSVSNLRESSGFVYRWSSEAIDVANPSLFATGPADSTLVARPGAFSPGLEYEFSLTVTDARGVSGTGTTVVATNAPPSAGACESSPPAGDSDTEFRLACIGYVDGDQPLRYRFSVRSTTFFQLTEWQYSNTFKTKLPASRPGSLTDIRAEVEDSLGYATAVYFGVNVTAVLIPETDRADYVADVVQNEVLDLIDRGDMRSLAVVFTVAADVLKSSPKGNATNSARSAMLSAVGALINASSPDPEAINTQAQMLEMITDAEELSDETRDEALGLVEGLSSTDDPKAVQRMAQAAVGVISNLAQTLINVQVDGGVDPETRPAPQASPAVQRKTAARFERILFSVAGAEASELVEGETPARVSAGSVTLDVQRLRPTGAEEASGAAQASAAQGVTLPAGGAFSVGPATCTVMHSPNWLPRANETLSGILGFALLNASSRTPQALNVSELAEPLNLTLRATDFARGFAPSCRYYDYVNESWTSSGCITVYNPNHSRPLVRCLCSRLVNAYNDALTKNESSGGGKPGPARGEPRMTSFAIGMNAIGPSDITADAFSYKNPIFVLLASLLLAYAVVLIWARKRDSRETSFELKLQFYAMQAHFDGVLSFNPSEISKHVSFRRLLAWHLSRNHTWFSIFMRPSGDWMTSTARATLLLLVLFNTVAVSALFMGQTQRIGSMPADVANMLVTFSFAFPIPFFVIKLFGWSSSTNRAYVHEASRRRKIVDIMERSERDGRDKKEARRVRRGAVSQGRSAIHEWERQRRTDAIRRAAASSTCTRAAYAICVVWILGCFFYTSVAAFKIYTQGDNVGHFGSYRYDRWLAVVLASWATDVFNRTLVSVMVISVFLLAQTMYRKPKISTEQPSAGLSSNRAQPKPLSPRDLISTASLQQVHALRGREESDMIQSFESSNRMPPMASTPHTRDPQIGLTLRTSAEGILSRQVSKPQLRMRAVTGDAGARRERKVKWMMKKANTRQARRADRASARTRNNATSSRTSLFFDESDGKLRSPPAGSLAGLQGDILALGSRKVTSSRTRLYLDESDDKLRSPRVIANTMTGSSVGLQGDDLALGSRSATPETSSTETDSAPGKAGDENRRQGAIERRLRKVPTSYAL